ncbi:TPA: UDP-N-acetylenolpyruvoylglucosamine reductase [Candidatus Nomurabacteria bacterium]|nr:UDP-N-acetylenolpyruvoylglucosamine reductase [Candidatus Nomurabacteria bacterium]
MEIRKVSMKEYSALRVGGMGDLVVVKSEEELKDAVEYAAAGGRRIHILGSGTNTYFAEDLSKYLFLKLEIIGYKIQDTGSKKQGGSDTNNEKRITNNEVFLTTFAGETFDDIVKYSVEQNLWGIENLSHIPGSVGAAPVQNIGAYGVELKDTLVSIRVFDIEANLFKDLLNSECDFAYRDSFFKHNPGKYIIISITLNLTKEFKPVLEYKPLDSLQGKAGLTSKDVRDLVIATRLTKLPDWKKFPNTGSFFKNIIITKEEWDTLKMTYPDMPVHEVRGGYKVPTAWLIEHVADAKGLKVGDVGTWPNQPLVIVNYGNADAEEINEFASNIQKKVEEKTGIKLEREVVFVRS